MVVLSEFFSNDQMLPLRRQCKPHVYRTAHLKRPKIDEAKFHMKAIIECVNVHLVNLLLITRRGSMGVWGIHTPPPPEINRTKLLAKLCFC